MHDADKNIELSKYRLSLAAETYRNAKMCFDNKFYRDCINRSYYAVFYGIRAVLALENIDFKRHKDVVAYFNKTYVAFIVSADEAETQLQSVEYMLSFIREYLVKYNVNF